MLLSGRERGRGPQLWPEWSCALVQNAEHQRRFDFAVNLYFSFCAEVPFQNEWHPKGVSVSDVKVTVVFKFHVASLRRRGAGPPHVLGPLLRGWPSVRSRLLRMGLTF